VNCVILLNYINQCRSKSIKPIKKKLISELKLGMIKMGFIEIKEIVTKYKGN